MTLLPPIAARRCIFVLAAIAAVLLSASAPPAIADFRLCNNTGSRVGIALGYKDAEGWTTEGWWNVSPRTCETLLRGALVARYYYIYAVDYDRGGEWSGHAYMCSREKEFTIRGIRQLPGARLRPHRLLRGRHRRAALLDGAIDRQRRAIARAQTGGDASAGKPATPGGEPAARQRQRQQAMRRLRRAKIVATLGPASSSAEMIARLFEAGVDVFRINMSHTSQDRMRELIATIRAIERNSGRPIGVLVDLQGPKLRLGTFLGGQAMVAKGDSFVLDSDSAPGDATRVYLPHPEIFMAVEPGHTLLIDDGKIRLTVTEAESQPHGDARRGRRQARPTARASACRTPPFRPRR